MSLNELESSSNSSPVRMSERMSRLPLRTVSAVEVRRRTGESTMDLMMR